MKINILYLFLLLFASPSFAQRGNNPRYMHLIGTLGKLPITMDLEIVGSQASGRFYFNKMGQPIYLHDGDFEQEIPNFGGEVMVLSEMYGAWEGKLRKDKFSGTWTSIDGRKRLPFELVESYIQSMQFVPLVFDNSQNSLAESKAKVTIGYPTALKETDVLQQLRSEIGKAVIFQPLPNLVRISSFQLEVLERYSKDRDIKSTEVKMDIFLNESNLLTISAYQSGKNKKGDAAGAIRSEYFTWDLLTGKQISIKDVLIDNYQSKLEQILQEVIKRDYEGKIFGDLVLDKGGILKGGMMFRFENAYLTSEVFVAYKELQAVIKPNAPISVLMK
jgi:hypothetical protein